jgi:HEAT repeat protein
MGTPDSAPTSIEAPYAAPGGDSSKIGGVRPAVLPGAPEGQHEQPGKNEEAARRTAAVLDALAVSGSHGLSAMVGALRSNDDDVVMYAATALGDARDPAAVPHLIRLLQHPDLNVAQAAIDALGKLRAQSAAAPIEAMLEADPWLRFAAAHALGEIGHPGSVHALMRVAGDSAISEQAIAALGKIATVPATTVLAELLASRVSAGDFSGCLLALGNALRRMIDPTGLDGSRAWQRLSSAEAGAVHARLVDLLLRRDGGSAADGHALKEAAITVIRALALPALYPTLIEAAWDPALGEPLLDAMVFAGPAVHGCVLAGLGHADADVQVFCATAASALGMAEAAGPCERLLASEEVRVRVAALRALAGLSAEPALPAMLRCLADPSESVRNAAVRSLGGMDANLVTTTLLAERDFARDHATLVLEVMRMAPCSAQRDFVAMALKDPREEVRRAAVGVLSANEQMDVVEILEPLLRDPAVAVRAVVVQALGRRRSHRALLQLQHQFEIDVETRQQVLRAIGRIGDGSAARRLMVWYPEQERRIRLAIVDALGAIAAPAAEPFLAQLLSHAQPEVRGRAVVAIGQYTTDGAVRRLAHATRDVDARVRLAALESLSTFTGRLVAIEAFERLCLDPLPAIAALARRCLRKD